MNRTIRRSGLGFALSSPSVIVVAAPPQARRGTLYLVAGHHQLLLLLQILHQLVINHGLNTGIMECRPDDQDNRKVPGLTNVSVFQEKLITKLWLEAAQILSLVCI